MKRIITLSFFYISIITNSNGQSFIVGDTISANITYVNIPDTSLPFIVKGSSIFDIDIDFDSIKHVRFYRDHSSSPSFESERYSVSSLDSIQFVCTSSTSNDADSLSLGDVIDENLNWNNNYSGAVFYSYFNSVAPPPWGPGKSSHGICTKPNTYIGFEKINQNDTLYGWFNLDLLGPYRIKSFAVNKHFKPKRNFPQASAISAYSLSIDNDSQRVETTIYLKTFNAELYNLNGKKIFQGIFKNLNPPYQIDISGYSQGIYFLKLFNENETIIRKMFVQ